MNISGLKKASRFLYRLIDSRFFSGKPILLSHLVTLRCNCKCDTCLWSKPGSNDELSSNEIEKIYQDARDLGFIINSIWGGEPLIREDIAQIVKASKENNLLTVVITNGYFLRERIKEISEYVDCFVFSIDYPSEKHDEMRHCKGIFNKAIQGIELVKGKFPDIKIIINSVVSKFNSEKIRELADLSKELDVSIYFCPMEVGLMTSKGFNNRKGYLALNQNELSDFAYEVISLKKQGYKINNSYNYLNTFAGGKKKFKCNVRKFAIQIYPNGDIINCIARDKPVANLKNISLKDLFYMEKIKNLRFSDVNCSICNNPDIIDSSYIWDLKLESIWSYIKLNYL